MSTPARCAFAPVLLLREREQAAFEAELDELSATMRELSVVVARLTTTLRGLNSPGDQA
jgi:hypothetical protein